MGETGMTRWVVTVTSGVVALMGAGLLGGGAWLIRLGDTPYYALAGALLLVEAALLWRRDRLALTVHAIVILLTLGWGLYEVGLDWWPLAIRLNVPFLVGLWLWLPALSGRLHARRDQEVRSGAVASLPRGLLGVSLAAFVVVAIGSWLHDPHEVTGSLPAMPRTATVPDPVPAADWHAYGRSQMGQRYAPLAQITPANVADLSVAWHYRTGDVRGRPGDPEETTFEVTPLKVGDLLYLCTPHQMVVALDATTGVERWRVTLRVQGGLALQHLTCRGLAYHPGPGTAPPVSETPAAATSSPPTAALPVAARSGPHVNRCGARLFMPTADGRVVALDPATGAVCADFGGGTGQINLWEGMPNVRVGGYYATSPPAIAGDRLIIGGTVLDNVSMRQPSGVIRAYDVYSGRLLWNWDPGRPDDTAPLAPGQTYVESTPNSWSVSAVDEALGLVYVPMGNAPPDQWGARRTPETERFSSSVVALDVATGRLRWVFQTVHHDLWDYDVPAQPSLLDITLGGRQVPALVQATKQGELFVLDRRTGRPIWPVRERPAPQTAQAGDRAAPTQPVSAISFNPPRLTGADAWGATLFDQLGCRIALKRLHYEGRFTPPSVRGALIHPGNFGVFNWGGIAVDPQRQVAFVTPTYLAFTSQLVPRPDDESLVVQGEARPQDSLPALNENFGAPYAVKLAAFTSPFGLPCHQPPWGHVAGVDLMTGRVAWRHRNGTVRDLAPVPLPFRMGVPNLGGPIVTAGGVAFLSGTLDNSVRGYDLVSGRELWQARLPAGGQATPMTYQGADGRQYLVVVAGGHGSLGTKAGDHVIAYALPRP